MATVLVVTSATETVVPVFEGAVWFSRVAVVCSAVFITNLPFFVFIVVDPNARRERLKIDLMFSRPSGTEFQF